jgi:hypothetical protein
MLWQKKRIFFPPSLCPAVQGSEKYTPEVNRFDDRERGRELCSSLPERDV